MSRQIKLIWDFRGATAEKTAEHHVIHLKQYIESEKLDLDITGFSIVNELTRDCKSSAKSGPIEVIS